MSSVLTRLSRRSSRVALLALALALACQSARATTAYEALRVLGKARGETILDNVTEVRGTNGAPQPREWKIIVKDASTRGGTKEFDVQGTRLLGEKAPSFRATGSPMNMSQLNLDSDGVHQVAEREAKKAGFPYDHADYTLRAGTHGGSPVWEIRLVDDTSGDVATLNVAATTGNIVSTEGLVKRRNNTAVAPPPERYPREAERYTEPVQQSPGPGLQRASDDLNNFFDRVGRHFERRGRQIGDTFHNLFSKDKQHTAGPHGSSQKYDDQPQGRETDDTDYVKPSRVRD